MRYCQSSLLILNFLNLLILDVLLRNNWSKILWLNEDFYWHLKFINEKRKLFFFKSEITLLKWKKNIKIKMFNKVWFFWLGLLIQAKVTGAIKLMSIKAIKSSRRYPWEQTNCTAWPLQNHTSWNQKVKMPGVNMCLRVYFLLFFLNLYRWKLGPHWLANKIWYDKICNQFTNWMLNIQFTKY